MEGNCDGGGPLCSSLLGQIRTKERHNFVRLEAMARTKQTARVQPVTRATGGDKKNRTKRKREEAKRRKKKEEIEETSTSEGVEGEETTKKKPKGADKGDEDLEVLDSQSMFLAGRTKRKSEFVF